MRAARARPPVSSRWLAEGVTVAEGRRDGVGDRAGVGVGVSVALGGACGLSVLWLRTRYPTIAPEVTTSSATATSAAITCNSGELSNRIGFLQFDTDADMTRFITTTKNTIAADRFGRCDKGLGQSNPWTYRGQTKGDLACVRTGTPLVTKVWWSSFGTGVVASAQDTDAAKAWNWFLGNSLIVE